VTFGSIDDASAPISSSPASAPAVKPAEGVKSFGSVAVQNGVSDATKSAVVNRPPQLSSAPTSSSQAAAPTSTPPPVQKFSVAKLFQGPSTQSGPAPPPEAASPALRSAPLPPQAPGQGQPYQPPFTSGSTLRQGQNGNPSAPRSPVYSRPMTNGQSSGAGVSGRPQAGSGGPSAGPAPTTLSSPRLTPHPPPGPQSGLPPPHAVWPGYYVRVPLLPCHDDVTIFDISVLYYSITLHSSLMCLQSNFINHNGPATSSHLSTSRLRLTIRQARLHHPRVYPCHQETHPYHYNKYRARLPNHMPSHLFTILLIHPLRSHHPPSHHHRRRLLSPIVQHHSVPTLVLSSRRRFRSRTLLDKRLILTH
jgi:hypothetical protein